MSKTSDQLKAQLSDVTSKMQAILDAADKDTAGKLSTEQNDEYTKLNAEFDSLTAELKAVVDAAAERDRRQKEFAEKQKSAADTLAMIPAGGGRKSSPNPFHIEVQPPEKFKSLGEQLQAIALAGIYPERNDNRLTWEQLAPATGGAVSSIPSDGGYLIQKDFVTELMNKTSEMSMLWSRVRKIPVSSNSDGLKLVTINETSRATGSRWGGVQVYWGAEADAATAKKPAFRQMELELKDLIGLAYATDRLLQDATAIEAVFMQAFSEEISFMLDDAVYNGDGAGKPLGISNAPCVVSVAKETGQPAATLVKENIDKMWSRMWARSRANAVWFINQDCEPQLDSMKHDIGTGGVPVYLPPGGLSQSPFATLKGRPVIPIEHAATLGTTGDIMLADLTQYIGIEKGGVRADSSIHVRFTTNERTFRFITRADGQPLWNSALTPFKGSATKSPFVKLDTRS
jgi:HK97 family phage major capsid protein